MKMKNMIKRFLAVILALMLLLPCFAAAEEETIEEDITEEETGEEETVTEKDGWYFDAKGFLAGDSNPGEEYLKEDEENGVWRYATKDLSITVTRYEEKVKVKSGKRSRVYCVAEVYCTPESPLFTVTSPRTKENVKKYAGLPGYRISNPEVLVKNNPVILAVSDDFYGGRMQKVVDKKASWPIGVIIRNGELLNSKTRDGKKPQWPSLDTLAVFEDGSMKAEPVASKTAEDFVAEKATQVFSFGPWLIHEGEINVKGVDSSKSYMYNDAQYSEPRVAVGMVEPFHYILIAVQGRPTSKYIGVKLDWLADKMKEYGCTEAGNLDGGGTVAMLFNGKTILQGYKDDPRPLGSMIAFGSKGE